MGTPELHRELRSLLEYLSSLTPALPRDRRLIEALIQVYHASLSNYERLKKVYLKKQFHQTSGFSDWMAHETFYKKFENVYIAFANYTDQRDSGFSKSSASTRFKDKLRWFRTSQPPTSFLNLFKLDWIAKHFYLIEAMLLHAVPWTALVDKEHASVQALIDRFNLGCQWVPSEICYHKNMSDRVKIIEKIIKLAQKCYQMRNYATLTQLMLGLQNPYVDRLKKTWQRVSHSCKKTMRMLVSFTSPLKNFSSLRKSMQDHQGIPFTGLFLGDLVFTAEAPDNVDEKYIHYRKYQVMAKVINDLCQFQANLPEIPWKPDITVYSCCLCLEAVSDETLKQMSEECERKREF